MSIETQLRGLGFTVEGDVVEAELALDEFCPQVVEYAKSLAPVFDSERDRRQTPGIGDPEDYKNSIKTTPVGPGHRRVGSDDPKAVWVELGSRHMPEYAVFAKTAKYFGGTGPVVVSVGGHDEGIEKAQHHLRGELERLEKLVATGAAVHQIKAQRLAVNQARVARSAAFNANRPRRRGRRR